MLGYHGSDEAAITLHAGIANGIYLAKDPAVATAYALRTAAQPNGSGTAHLHTITIADAANIADKRDLKDVLDDIAADEDADFDPADYGTWECCEFPEVRKALRDAGYDGVELRDQGLDGEDHDSILVWATDLLTITTTVALETT